MFGFAIFSHKVNIDLTALKLCGGEYVLGCLAFLNVSKLNKCITNTTGNTSLLLLLAGYARCSYKLDVRMKLFDLLCSLRLLVRKSDVQSSGVLFSLTRFLVLKIEKL